MGGDGTLLGPGRGIEGGWEGVGLQVLSAHGGVPIRRHVPLHLSPPFIRLSVRRSATSICPPVRDARGPRGERGGPRSPEESVSTLRLSFHTFRSSLTRLVLKYYLCHMLVFTHMHTRHANAPVGKTLIQLCPFHAHTHV